MESRGGRLWFGTSDVERVSGDAEAIESESEGVADVATTDEIDAGDDEVRALGEKCSISIIGRER